MFALANDRRESPHKLPVSIFKERPGAGRGSRALCGIPRGCQHRRGIISLSGSSFDPGRSRGSSRKGAQYSEVKRAVNTRFFGPPDGENLTAQEAPGNPLRRSGHRRKVLELQALRAQRSPPDGARTSSASSSGVRTSDSCRRTPSRSASARFWLDLNLPSSTSTSISKPTIPRTIASM